MAGLRNGLRKIAEDRREWAGIPMVLEDAPLTIEPTYPMAEKLMAIGRKEEAETPLPSDVRLRNEFWSWRFRCNVVIWDEGGKVHWGKLREPSQAMGMLVDTLKVSDAWGIEQEANAIDTLGSLLRHRQFKQYLMTGMFMEKSERSGVHYLFRKLRPTIAMTVKGKHGLKFLAALCLHPIGYYKGSWAGAMTPTDDVVAHLMLMRGDEHMLWRRANQHSAWDPAAGIN